MPTRLVIVMIALVASLALAQERYSDPTGRFDTPLPAGW